MTFFLDKADLKFQISMLHSTLKIIDSSKTFFTDLMLYNKRMTITLYTFVQSFIENNSCNFANRRVFLQTPNQLLVSIAHDRQNNCW